MQCRRCDKTQSSAGKQTRAELAKLKLVKESSPFDTADGLRVSGSEPTF
ncbi:MAG: hypothetical protein ACOCW1_03125 [Chitinispirillaceae bacterium]